MDQEPITAADATPQPARCPLTGVRVLDLSRILAGPFCCQVLADLGADVVKVERPGSGDDTRAWGPPFLNGDGPSAYYLSANRGKRSLAVDLKHPQSRPMLEALVRRADVLVENFRLESLEELGLAPENLKRLNPDLVSCSISGYGRTGPSSSVPGYDLMIQATAGLMSITGEPDGMPMKVGVAISDVIAGLYAALSVLAGLVARGKGQSPWAFDLALADCTLASLVNVAQGALVTGQRPKRYGNAHPQIVPYEVFATSDGHVVLAVGNDRQWRKFCEAIGRQPWADDPRFATNPARVKNRDELIGELSQLFRTRTSQQWIELLRRADVPHSPVLALDEILAGEQTRAREMVLPARDAAGRQFKLLGSAIHWHGQPPRWAMAPPALGQHSDEVLREWLGYDKSQIKRLRDAGAIA